MKSSYLYSPENKDLYKETLDEYNQKSCVFSRNLIALLETASLKQGPFYQKHIKECRVCQKMASDFAQKEKKIKAAIPVQTTPPDLAQNIKADLREALAYIEKKSRPKKTWSKELVKEGARDFFITMPRSQSFLKGLLLSFALWGILKLALY